MRVLISGAGIAGPALAWWLTHYGFQTTIVEKAPKLRSGGYIIDFWGAGFDVADRMGLLPEIVPKGYRVQEVRVVNQRGKRTAGFSAGVFTRVAGDRYLSLPRGDLAASIFGRIGTGAEAVFGNSVVSARETGKALRVAFEHGPEKEFDLLIGADGLHSRVRDLVFDPPERFERYLGYKAAAFEVEGYAPRDELVYVMYTRPGQQVARFALRGDRTMFLFIFADQDARCPPADDMQAQKALLRERFGNSGWECPRILEALDACDELYFDRVSQICMDAEGSWARGRVALIGDAAFCVSLLGGQGSALAMVAAYILAGEMFRARGDYARAFSRYQKLFGPFVAEKQRAALGFARFFAPESQAALFVRNRIMNLLSVPWVADRVFSAELTDKLALEEY